MANTIKVSFISASNINKEILFSSPASQLLFLRQSMLYVRASINELTDSLLMHHLGVGFSKQSI